MAADPYLVLVAAVFGAIVGSFLNVCIVRLPRDQSVVSPRSRCPECDTPIAWYDNVPLLSWVVLRARCRHCRAGISWRYPAVESLTALIWGAAFWFYALSWDALTAACFGTILLGILVTDATHYLIPDEFTWGGLGLGLALAFRSGLAGVWEAALGAAVGFAVLYLVAVFGSKAFGKEAMGGGDIKMMAMVGAFVGWKGVLITIFGGALLGTIVFGPIALRTKKLVPFGVFLSLGAAVAFVGGDELIRWYLDWLR